MSSAWITVNDLKLHYTRQGDGPSLLLLHGYGHAHTMWARPLGSYLRDNFCCYAVDLPGHGRSDNPPLAWYSLDNYTTTLEQFCQRLGLDRVRLVGYSMGGLVGLNLALIRPEMIADMITINAPIKGDFLALFDWLLPLAPLARFRVSQFLLKLYTHFYLLALPVEAQRYARLRMLFSDSFRHVQHQLAQCTPQSLFGSYRVVRYADLSDRLEGLQMPLLVIISDHDRVVPPEQGRYLSQHVAQADLAIIPGSGHLPLDEQPDLFDAILQTRLQIRTDASLEP